MTEINLVKRVKEWCVYKGIQGLSDDDINLGRVKSKVDDVTWSFFQQGKINERHRTGQAGIVPVNLPGTVGGALGQVHTSKDTEDGVTVTILSETIKGLNRSITLSPPLSELKAIFGDIQIDPSKKKSNMEAKMNLGVAMEHTLSPRGATADRRYTVKNCKARFTCTVVLEGNVTWWSRNPDTHVGQQQLSEILTDLKNIYAATSYPEPDDLAALTIKKKKVELTMMGDVELRWESDHSLTWQDNR